jgi:hypothetical protein
MKRFHALAAALMPALLLCTGCVDLDTTLTLKPDSSGTLDVRYTVAEDAVRQFRALYGLRADLMRAGGGPDAETVRETVPFLLEPDENRIRAGLAPYADNGLTLERLKVDVLNNSRRVQMTLNFRSLADLARADFFAEYGFSLLRTEGGNYLLHREGYTFDSNGLADVSDPATVKMLSPFLSGFRAALKIVVPGPILETNAARPTRFAATWLHDFDRDPNALAALQSTDMTVLFQGEGLRLPQVRRRFKDDGDTAQPTE